MNTDITPRLRPCDFIHPVDEQALRAMKEIPLFPQILQAFMKYFNEAHFETTAMAEKILLGPEQMPEVYNLLPPICEFYGIPVPMMFLEQGPANAYVTGNTKVFLVVTSGLLQSLEKDELRAVLAHECGHIVCQHMLYYSLAQKLKWLGESSIPFVAQLSTPLRLAILAWSRKSELSADRAAALYMRGADPTVEAFMRLAGWPKYLPGQINRAAYMKQAEAFNQLIQSDWNDALQSLDAINQEHPFLAVRAREIETWCGGQQFLKLMEGLELSNNGPATITCPACGGLVPDVSRFCHLCGGVLVANSDSK